MDTILVTGGAGVAGPQEERSVRSLASKVLCEHHNSMLSLCDTEGIRLARLMRWFVEPGRFSLHTIPGLHIQPLRVDPFQRRGILLDGVRVSRWAHKLVLGTLVSRMVSVSDPWLTESLRSWRPPERLLRHLFWSEHPGENLSVRFRNATGSATLSGSQVTVSFVWSAETGEPVGAELDVFGLQLIVLWEHEDRFADSLVDNTLPWPGLLELQRTESTTYVFFAWPAGWTQQVTHLIVGPPIPTSQPDT